MAALIIACSKCAASPGHTAQPFQPTSTAITFLSKSWERDLLKDVRSALESLSQDHALVKGSASVGEANAVAPNLASSDLVFVDPPYSAVQYSRFYHVLEAVAVGKADTVFGVGRYPPREHRPTSAYSSTAQSLGAFEDLLEKLAKSQATVVLTFPDHQCSNGISGDAVREISAQHFRVVESAVSSVFSTMGGSTTGIAKRSARRHASELILLLRPH
ncbi:DNA adenine methylase [Comamonas antarctica]|uniref:DNA adenine methylase n=1 Tax=Comamonas antarctica TaxID=2743470 RepID=UPI0028E6ED4A|nr:DNA adenine methylase [Comamonas antarctica]